MEHFSAWWSCFLFPLEISPAGTAASLELLAWPWYHTIFFSSCHFLLIWNTQKILYPSIWIITELAVKWKIAYKYDHFVNFHSLYSIRAIVICFKYPFSSYSILHFICIYAEKTKNHFYLERPASRLKYFCVALAVASQPAPAGVESAPNGSFTDYVTEEGPVKKTL